MLLSPYSRLIKFSNFLGHRIFLIELLPEEFTSVSNIDVLICCMAYCRKNSMYHFLLLSTLFLILAALLTRVKAWRLTNSVYVSPNLENYHEKQQEKLISFFKEVFSEVSNQLH